MNVGQLKKELEKYPDDMDVFMAERKTEFAYGLVNSISSKEIPFNEDDGAVVGGLGRDTVVILDED